MGLEGKGETEENIRKVKGHRKRIKERTSLI